MLYTRAIRNQRNRTLADIRENKQRIAREKSRTKPEDAMSKNFLIGFLVALVGFVKKLFGFFGKHRGIEKHRTHARGWSGTKGAFGKSKGSSMLAGPPQRRRNDDATMQRCRDRRKMRKYIARGYGYIEPEPKKEKAVA